MVHRRDRNTMHAPFYCCWGCLKYFNCVHTLFCVLCGDSVRAIAPHVRAAFMEGSSANTSNVLVSVLPPKCTCASHAFFSSGRH